MAGPNPVPTMADISGAFAPLVKALAELADVVKNVVMTPLDQLKKSFQELGSVARQAIPSLAQFFSGIKDGFKDLFRENIGLRVAAVFQGIKKAILFALPTDVTDNMVRIGSQIPAALGGIAKAFGSLLAVTAVATTGIIAVGSALGTFANKANPAVFAQFQLALDDLMAVIGQALVPLFTNFLIPALRIAGDALTYLFPIFSALTVALKPVLDVFEFMTDVTYELFSALGAVVQKITPYFVAFTKVLGDMVRQLGKWIQDILGYLGIDIGEFGAERGISVGASARTAQTGSIESVIQKAQAVAFGGPGGIGDPARATATGVAALNAKAEEIYKAMLKIPSQIGEYIANLPAGIAKAILGEGAGKTTSGVTEIAKRDIGTAITTAPIAMTAYLKDVGTSVGDWITRRVSE
jgi:hypothetical protein